jgi:hypothetical protein
VICRAEVIAVLAFEIEPRLKPVAVARFEARPPPFSETRLDPRTLNPEK